jgi:hypothetical protein
MGLLVCLPGWRTEATTGLVAVAPFWRRCKKLVLLYYFSPPCLSGGHASASPTGATVPTSIVRAGKGKGPAPSVQSMTRLPIACRRRWRCRDDGIVPSRGGAACGRHRLVPASDDARRPYQSQARRAAFGHAGTGMHLRPWSQPASLVSVVRRRSHVAGATRSVGPPPAGLQHFRRCKVRGTARRGRR